MYIHLLYGNFNKDPMSIVNTTKADIASKYQNKIQTSAAVEQTMRDLLDINIGDIMVANEKAQEGIRLTTEVNALIDLLKQKEQEFTKNTDYITFLNEHVTPLMKKVMDYATSVGGYTKDSIDQLQTAQNSLNELETRISTQYTSGGAILAKKQTKNKTESKIVNVLNGIFNNVRGPLGEIANIAGLIGALAKGNKEFIVANIGGTSGVGGLIKETTDPALRAQTQALNGALQSLSLQSKEDVHAVIHMTEDGGNVSAQWLHVGFSSKIAKGNHIHVQNTTLNAMLNTAYPGQQEFLLNLAAGLASDSNTAKELGLSSIGTWTNVILQTAWKETINNAYKLLLADYIAGNYSGYGSSVNYLIVNQEVFPISHVLTKVMHDTDTIGSWNFSQGEGDNNYISSRGIFVASQKEAFQNDPNDKEQRSAIVQEKVLSAWSKAKISVSLNYTMLR